LRHLAGIIDGDIVLLAGSTQEPEEQIAIGIFRRLAPKHPRLRLILVPRHPERFDTVAEQLSATKLPWLRRSQLALSPNPSLQGSGIINSRDATHRRVPHPIVLVDTVGELGAWWGAAHIAFVGGSFGNRGGQNMLEPAAYGAAVSFGPNTRNFRDIVASLLSANAAVAVNDECALEVFVRRCLEEPSFAAALGLRAQQLVRSQLGATARTVTLLDSLMSVNDKTATNRAAA
jgi:3-deoxy-D-manno-octulosonic-acid transferase